MSDNTKIEWADATANYINGCSVVSPGCTNCYAMRLAGTRMKHHPTRAGLTDDSKAGPVWNGTVRTNDKVLAEVLAWKRPRRIFWNAHGDLFHPAVSDETIDRQFAVMALTPQHQHLVLTKRPERMLQYFRHDRRATIFEHIADLRRDHFHSAPAFEAIGKLCSWDKEPLPNVWLGTSVEDQARADERIPHLLATPAAVRFISAEPLLGPVDLTNIPSKVNGVDRPLMQCNALSGEHYCGPAVGHDGAAIDWVIVGGESGPGARPMHPGWARSLRDQCAAAGVPFLFKQWGEWLPCVTDHDGERLVVYSEDGFDNPVFESETRRPVKTEHGQEFWRVGKARAGRLLDGVQHDGFPA